MRKAVILLLLALMAGQHALAGDEGSEKNGEGTFKKAGEAAGRGIEKGAEAAGRGIKKGGRAAGKGVEKAGAWVQKKLGNGGGKKEGADKKEGSN
jgi:hypothetical protein